MAIGILLVLKQVTGVALCRGRRALKLVLPTVAWLLNTFYLQSTLPRHYHDLQLKHHDLTSSCHRRSCAIVHRNQYSTTNLQLPQSKSHWPSRVDHANRSGSLPL